MNQKRYFLEYWYKDKWNKYTFLAPLGYESLEDLLNELLSIDNLGSLGSRVRIVVVETTTTILE